MIFNKFATFIFGDYVKLPFFFLWHYNPNRTYAASLLRLLITHTHTHTRQDSSERVLSLSQRQLPTQHTTNRSNERHFLSGIRTRNHRNRAATDLRLSPQGHRHNYRLIFIINNHLVLHTIALCVQHPLLKSRILPVILNQRASCFL